MRPTLRQLASPKHASELQDWLRSVAARTHDRVRTHVISRDLCDESLRLLQPTLPKPGTCDVIDLNPGICVWSEAVHDALKPKRHILIEKRRDLYSKFIDPLLATPGSAYRYAPDVATAIARQNGFLSAEVTGEAHRTTHSTGLSGKEVQENKLLLVIANLTQSAQYIPGFTGTEAKRFLNNFYRSLFSKSGYIHQYGLVRLLAWTDDSSRKVIVPTSVITQTKQSLQLEAAFQITPIAGPNSYQSRTRQYRRWHPLDIENIASLSKIETKLAFTILEDRRPPSPSPPLQSFPPSTEFLAENRSMFPHSQRFIDDLLSIETKLATEDPEWLHRFTLNQEKGTIRPGLANHFMPNRNQDHTLYRRLLNQLQTYHNNYNKVIDKVNQHRTLWHQICEAEKPNRPAESRRLMALHTKYDALERETKAMTRDNRAIIYKAVDDYRAYDSSPQSMSWNRRKFEPLLVQPEEFYPQRPLSLIDLKPRTCLPERLNTVDKQICFDYVITNLFSYTGNSVVQGIKRLIGSGHEEFLNKIPELHNARDGGWYDLDNLRLRTLNWHFYLQFAETFEKWPYREPTERLLAMGSSIFQKPI